MTKCQINAPQYGYNFSLYALFIIEAAFYVIIRIRKKYIKGCAKLNPKILVGITIQENSRRLIDEGSRLSKELGAPLHILHIRRGETIFDEPESSTLLADLFDYAGNLGGEVHFVCGDHISEVFANFVKENQITHLVIGETPSYLAANAPSMYDTLTNELGNIEINVLQRETPEKK